MMFPPEVLTIREFRESLADRISGLQQPGAAALFVGAHRKPEVVIMSLAEYQSLQNRAVDPRRAMASALGSVRAEGLEPSQKAQEILDQVASGELTVAKVRTQLLALYGQ